MNTERRLQARYPLSVPVYLRLNSTVSRIFEGTSLDISSTCIAVKAEFGEELIEAYRSQRDSPKFCLLHFQLPETKYLCSLQGQLAHYRQLSPGLLHLIVIFTAYHGDSAHALTTYFTAIQGAKRYARPAAKTPIRGEKDRV